MKILMINVVCGIRSTGRICSDLAVALEKEGHAVKIAYGRENVPESIKQYAVKIGSDLSVNLHKAKSLIFDRCGFGSRKATLKFIEWIKDYDPDIIHIHNIHGYYIDVEVLFDFFKCFKGKIIWTLHDCWAFTGHCSYFEYAQCEKWKTLCYECPNKKEYPASVLFDSSKKNYLQKQKLFCGLKNLTIITPSNWLSKYVKESFLKEYPVYTIYNGIDTDVFKYTESNIKEKLGIQGKKVILGVAAIWNRRKGLDDFIKLSKIIDDSYKIVIVGLNKNQINSLPDNVIGIEKTNSTKELATFYSVADVYVNPTYEDNYPTTNIESIACGTPVITYNTGGSVESARYNGVVVEKGNVKGILDAILTIDSVNSTFMDVSKEKTVVEYLKLYSKL